MPLCGGAATTFSMSSVSPWWTLCSSGEARDGVGGEVDHESPAGEVIGDEAASGGGEGQADVTVAEGV